MPPPSRPALGLRFRERQVDANTETTVEKHQWCIFYLIQFGFHHFLTIVLAMNSLNEKKWKPLSFFSVLWGCYFTKACFVLTWKGIWSHFFDCHFEFTASGGLELQAGRGLACQGPSLAASLPVGGLQSNLTVVFRSLRPNNTERETDSLQASPDTLNILGLEGFSLGDVIWRDN